MSQLLQLSRKKPSYHKLIALSVISCLEENNWFLNPLVFEGTAHLKQHSYQMAISSYGMNIIKIAFQDDVDDSRKVPIAPFFSTNVSHMTLFERFRVKH